MTVAPGSPTEFRTAEAADRPAVLALVTPGSAAPTVDTSVAYFLRLAFEQSSTEARLIVAERNRVVTGFVLFGDVAGSIGTARLHHIAVARAERGASIGVRLCERAIAQVQTHGCRLIVAEIADDAISQAGRRLLDRCGFVECGRVTDYYRDGVDLVVLRRFLDPAAP